MEKKKHGNAKTHDMYVKEVNDLYGNDYTILGIYKNAATKLSVMHNKCGYRWDVYPGNILSGQSKCPNCSGKVRLNTDSFKKVVFDRMGATYTVVGEYINAYTKIKIIHDTCKYEWDVEPRIISTTKQEIKCPRCQNRERYTTEDFGKRIMEVTDNNYILKSEYVNNRIDVEIEHIVCNTIFKVAPARFLYEGIRCPECESKFSKGEQRIFEILSDRNIEFTPQYTFEDCRDINVLRYDFMVRFENKMILIEFDGEQHFKPVEFFGGEKGFKSLQRRDNIKNTYCKENNIKLIRIPYWKYDEIESILNKLIHNEELAIDRNFIFLSKLN